MLPLKNWLHVWKEEQKNQNKMLIKDSIPSNI